MAKTIESEPEQFTHQNSVLLYPNTEDHKNQAVRYLKQYIILCDLCYDSTFWIPPCHRNLSVVSRRSFSVNIWSARLGFISDRNDWCMSCGCIACDMYRHSSKIIITKLLPTTLAHSTNLYSPITKINGFSISYCTDLRSRFGKCLSLEENVTDHNKNYGIIL